MPSVRFPNRLVFDRHFFQDIKDKKFESQPSVITKLMRINDRASGCKRMHNVMSKRVFDDVLKLNPAFDRSLLRAAFFDRDNSTIDSINDEQERNIKLAIDLLDEEPHRTFIMTSAEMVEVYKNNPHFIGVKEIDVKAAQEAMGIIDDYFSDCMSR